MLVCWLIFNGTFSTNRPYILCCYYYVVKSGSSQVCSLYGGQPLSPDSGFLSSLTTMESGVGLASCPWLIDASPGQRINVTLYRFGGGHPGAAHAGHRPSAAVDYDADSCRQRGWSIDIREYNATVSL